MIASVATKGLVWKPCTVVDLVTSASRVIAQVKLRASVGASDEIVLNEHAFRDVVTCAVGRQRSGEHTPPMSMESNLT
jgi:hypothetical protein